MSSSSYAVVVLVLLAAVAVACGSDTTGSQPTESIAPPTESVTIGSCFLVVALQNLEPPMAAWELTDSFEANGIQWEIYDEGPEDGTQLTARGTVKPITVLVSVQGPVGDSAAGPSTQTVVAQVARSVVVDPIVSA